MNRKRRRFLLNLLSYSAPRSPVYKWASEMIVTDLLSRKWK